MTYRIILTPSAQRGLDRLPESVAAAAIELLHALAEDQRVGKPLRYDLEGLYGAKRGEYRIVYEIKKDSKEIWVIRIRHRRDAYRSS